MKKYLIILLALMIFTIGCKDNPLDDPFSDDFKQFNGTIDSVFDGLQSELAPAKIELITENVEAWNARWYMVNSAKKSIDVQYFILSEDMFGKSFLGLLIKKAKEGLKIRLMLDIRGCKYFAKDGKDYLRVLVNNGIEVKLFNPTKTAIIDTLKNLNAQYAISSNHDKMILVDDDMVITGGRNLNKDYLAHPDDYAYTFKDTDFIAKTSVLKTQLLKAYNDEYNRDINVTVDSLADSKKEAELLLKMDTMDSWIKNEEFKVYEGELLTANEVKEIQDSMNSFPKSRTYSTYEPFQNLIEPEIETKLVDKYSIHNTKEDPITESIIKFIDASQTEIILQNQYIVLSDDLKAALKRANDRGVRIVMVTNSPISASSMDIRITQAFFLKDWKPMMRSMKNLEIYAHTTEHKLHSKVFIFDRKITAIGTYNLDPMSEYINSELIVTIKSDEFANVSYQEIEKEMNSDETVQYLLNEDGSVKFGPGDLIDSASLDILLKTIGNLGFLRPMADQKK